MGGSQEEPEEVQPAVFVRTRLGTWWVFTLVVFIIAVGEFLLGLFYYEKYYKRERKLLEKLKTFIIDELNRGIDEEQIANRLLAVGWSNKEIVFALSWAKKDMHKKQRKDQHRKKGLLLKRTRSKRAKETSQKASTNPYAKGEKK